MAGAVPKHRNARPKLEMPQTLQTLDNFNDPLIIIDPFLACSKQDLETKSVAISETIENHVKHCETHLSVWLC